MTEPQTVNSRAKTAVVCVFSVGWLYLLSLGPASALKSSGAVDRIQGGSQILDAYASPGIMLLFVPGLGAAYEAYLRWWDDIDKPG